MHSHLMSMQERRRNETDADADPSRQLFLAKRELEIVSRFVGRCERTARPHWLRSEKPMRLLSPRRMFY